jgi:hypothetical protein
VFDEAFVPLALARFRKNRLLKNEFVDDRRVNRVTRAELLSKTGRVGLAAAVAVQLVASIVAPIAAKAHGCHCGNQNGRNVS